MVPKIRLDRLLGEATHWRYRSTCLDEPISCRFPVVPALLLESVLVRTRFN